MNIFQEYKVTLPSDQNVASWAENAGHQDWIPQTLPDSSSCVIFVSTKHSATVTIFKESQRVHVQFNGTGYLTTEEHNRLAEQFLADVGVNYEVLPTISEELSPLLNEALRHPDAFNEEDTKRLFDLVDASVEHDVTVPLETIMRYAVEVKGWSDKGAADFVSKYELLLKFKNYKPITL